MYEGMSHQPYNIFQWKFVAQVILYMYKAIVMQSLSHFFYLIKKEPISFFTLLRPFPLDRRSVRGTYSKCVMESTSTIQGEHCWEIVTAQPVS